jgi:hypothetical protein
VSLFLAIFRACLPARKPPPSIDDTAYDEMDDDDEYEVAPSDEGYEEERAASAFEKEKSLSSSSSGGRMTSSPRLTSSGSPRITMPSSTNGGATIAGSPLRSTSLLRSTSGATHAILAAAAPASPRDHAAYVYLPNVAADE